MRKWHIPYIVGILLVMAVVSIGCDYNTPYDTSNIPYTTETAKYIIETKTQSYFCNEYSLDSGGTLLVPTCWEKSGINFQFHTSRIYIGGDFVIKSNQEK